MKLDVKWIHCFGFIKVSHNFHVFRLLSNGVGWDQKDLTIAEELAHKQTGISASRQEKTINKLKNQKI
jgi:hypothetical protein